MSLSARPHLITTHGKTTNIYLLVTFRTDNTRRLKPSIPTSLTSPNAPNIDDSTNSDESCATSDEIQDGPQYNL